jgi:hypothetical protein
VRAPFPGNPAESLKEEINMREETVLPDKASVDALIKRLILFEPIAFAVATTLIVAYAWQSNPQTIQYALSQPNQIGKIATDIFIGFVPMILILIVLPFIVRRNLQNTVVRINSQGIGQSIGRKEAFIRWGSFDGYVLTHYPALQVFSKRTLFVTKVFNKKELDEKISKFIQRP